MEPATSDGWKRLEKSPFGQKLPRCTFPRRVSRSNLRDALWYMQAYGEESVLDTNPSSMRARIQACLPGGSALVLHAYISVVVDVYKRLGYLWATTTGNHSSTGRPLGTFSGAETVNLSWHANRSVELAQSPLKCAIFMAHPALPFHDWAA